VDKLASRMDRYYGSEYEKNNRSQKNQDLYQTIYEDNRYTNIEGIADIEKTNEVDISKIKEMLKSREDYQKNKKYMQILNRSHNYSSYQETEEDEDDRNYDINDVLSKAHNERGNNTVDYHSLKNTQYNILKNIKLDNENHPPQIENEEELMDMQEELLDRFGDLPGAVNNLLNIALIRSICHSVYVNGLVHKENEVKLLMYPKAKLAVEKIPGLIDKYKGSLKFLPQANPYFLYQLPKNPKGKTDNIQVFENVKKLLEDFKQLCQ
jgi:hypothetical protein